MEIEKIIIGDAKRAVDKKGRVILPTWTNFKPKQNLLLIDRNDFVGIEDYETHMRNADETIKKLKDIYSGNFSSSNKEELERTLNWAFSLSHAVPDETRRILLSDSFHERVKEDNMVLFKGGFLGVAMFFSNDDYLKCIGNKGQTLEKKL